MIINVRSRDIVEEFIDSGATDVKVDISKTGRDKASVYNALLTYLDRHSDLGVSVRKIKGDIILVNNAKQRTSS